MTYELDIARCNATAAVKNLFTNIVNDLVGAAGGDLSGNYPNPTVAKINGVALGTTTATAANLLIASGSTWVSTAVTGDITITSAGVTAIGAGKVTNTMLAGSIAPGKLTLNSANIIVGNVSNVGAAVSMSGNVTIDNTGATTIGALQVTNGMLAGSIAASKLVGTDIATVGTITAGTWHASVIAEIYGGTNQSTYTLGDTLYSSASNTLSKLAGNITTTRKFLRQTGNGSISAAPAWDTIVAADVPGSALTRTSDTNVTLTLAGSPATALLNAASITVGWSGTLAPSRGGLGLDASAWAQGDLIYISATGTFNHLAKDTNSTRYLSNTGASAGPAWAQVALTTGVSGTLPIGNGGTNNTSFTTNALVYYDGSKQTTSSALTYSTQLILTGGAFSQGDFADGDKFFLLGLTGAAKIAHGASWDFQSYSGDSRGSNPSSGQFSWYTVNASNVNTKHMGLSNTGLLTVDTVNINNAVAALTGTNAALIFGTDSSIADGNYINFGTGGRNIGVFNGGNFFLTANADYNATSNVYKYFSTAAASAIELSNASIDLKYVASGTVGTTATMSVGFSVTTGGNATFFGTGSYGGGTNVIFLTNAGTTPSTNPTGGYILYATAGAFKGRGTSGTTTNIGNAEPHCPHCGSDFGHGWNNPRYGGEIIVCKICEIETIINIKKAINYIASNDLNSLKSMKDFLSEDIKYVLWNKDRDDQYQNKQIPSDIGARMAEADVVKSAKIIH